MVGRNDDGAGAEAVLYERRGPVAFATLNRPEAMNSLTPQLVEELGNIIAEVSNDREVKALVVTGNERAFCAGADLKFVQRVFDDREQYYAFVHRLNEVLFALENAPLPTIAMVRGFALAGGLELLLACDLALASGDARIGDQHANFGLMAGGGGSQRLARRIGVQRAKELLYTGGWLSGVEAAEAGIVLRAVPGNGLAAEVDALTATLATKSRTGLAFVKRAVNRGIELPLQHGIDEELYALFEYFSSSDDPAEGLRAFVEKREPVFGD